MNSEMPSETEQVEELRKWAEEYARKKGWILNPDTKQLELILRGLVRNKRKFGEPYCLCRIRSGDREKDRASICPCIYSHDAVMKEGHCHCHFFFKKTKEGLAPIDDSKS